MKIPVLITLVLAAARLVSAQSLVPIDRPDPTFPPITEAFEGKTTVQRTAGAGGLAHYMIRFFHEDVVGANRTPFLSDVVLSVTDKNGKILSQSWLDVSGVSTVPPDKTEFRMILFTVSEDLEDRSVLSIGLHKGMRVYFSPFRLTSKQTEAERDCRKTSVDR
jgi:hypothetical protein